ncbi:hypothetical protein F4859DRAFT_520593 [Xylaria cf. heliscus]|nr:hypothetical protein F4859DRAFT_520593 [Xylaria cf. heliscus]
MFPQLNYSNEPIAIIGSACRFPGGASSPSKLWQLIREPRDLVREIPPDRFNVEGFYHVNGLRRGTSNIKDAYTLSEDPRVFDADFFAIKPVEAAGLDPNHRLLLEVTYEALESAGLPRENIRGSHMGVFVGLMGEDYSSIGGRDIQNTPRYFASGAARSLLSNRLSYFFDLHGPSMTIDTACSSSLVALHQAVQSLRSGESMSAIVAGSNLILGPEPFIAESQLKMLSPTGRSRMWDKGADGYARADGIGALILKRLSDAIANNDSVECIIRETGVNQDGRTQGITTPSPKAQADLIRQTYRRTGLDFTKVSDMPHYFEAHGTGTPTGDPIEATAINSVFFHDSTFNSSGSGQIDHTMYVGSLKTVMGHSEGAAGVAGVMKASLALQNAIIPPNLLFNQINPQIAPFSKHLQVPREALPWPVISRGTPRRASVNSFGFGGTNAHAILENFLSNQPDIPLNVGPKFSPIIPFTFSAMSKKSLFGVLSSYVSHLQEHPSISLRDLSWTINTRRSDLPVRIAISASSVPDLVTKLEAACKGWETLQASSLIEDDMSKIRILGIFTGQGAQWATMGAKLLRESSVVVDCFERMQKSLDTLPSDYKPTWVLSEELIKAAGESSIEQVRFSQPICTAVQIALVDLLRCARVDFAAMVGHSSGEIAAAYTAGYLSAEDAIRVAYLRGHFCDIMKVSVTSPAGAMMAIGTTRDDALELISLPAFEGRVCIAAINSPTSVTVSGDVDALARISLVMDDEKKFCRLLRVDRAYHSHHMLPSMGPYVKALQDCGLRIRTRLPANSYPSWISSVVTENVENLDLNCLKGQYWGDNMIKTVLFSQAVEHAIQACGPFNMVIECGPHSALKGPTTDVIERALGTSIPYTGTLSRGCDDRESFGNTLGSLWATLGKNVVDFDAFDKAIHGNTPPKLLKGLPVYSWAHDRIFWHESRQTAALRNDKGRVHQLIGSICPDQSDRETRFRNYLSLDELSWLKGHQIQGKVIFPAAGYVTAVIEAAIHLTPIDTIELLELSDLSFKHALVLDDDSAVETQLSFTVLTRGKTNLQAVFSFYSDSRSGAAMLQENASGKIRIFFGESSSDSLPQPPLKVDSAEWLGVGANIFYESISKLGYNYSDQFQGLSDMKRRMNEATGSIMNPKHSGGSDPPLAVHPAVLDSAIQGILLASSFPNDGALHHLHLPSGIDRIRLNVLACQKLAGLPGKNLTFHAFADLQVGELVGDVDICSAHDKVVMIQLEGLHAIPLGTTSVQNVETKFFEYKWAPETLDGFELSRNHPEASSDLTFLEIQERVALFHLRMINTHFLTNGRANVPKRFNELLNFIDACVTRAGAGNHPYAKEEWGYDVREMIDQLVQQHAYPAAVKHIDAVGKSLFLKLQEVPSSIDTTTLLDLSDDLHSQALGVTTSFQLVAEVVKQLNHRFAGLSILEVGNRIGSAGRHILGEVGQTIGTYTYTEISGEQLEKAQERLGNYGKDVNFELFDPTKPMETAKVIVGPYDLIIAPMPVGSRLEAEPTIKNLRSIVKAAGYLVVLVATSFRLNLILGNLSVGQLSSNTPKVFTSAVSKHEWTDMLRRNGFTTLDVNQSQNNKLPSAFSILVAQAVDYRVKILRDPLAPDHEPLRSPSLTIVGGSQLEPLVHDIQKHYCAIQQFQTLSDIESARLPPLGTVICLVDLEENSVFQHMTAVKLRALQKLFSQCKNVFWVSCGARTKNAFKNMFVGLQRTVMLEMPHLRVQYLEFSSSNEINYSVVAKKLIQLEALRIWDDADELKSILWTLEPELSVRNGVVEIPRLLPDLARNERHASKQRNLTSTAAITQNISIEQKGSQLQVQVEEPLPSPEQGNIRLIYSLLWPVNFHSCGTAFISIGQEIETGNHMLVVSETLKSVVRASPKWTISELRSDMPMAKTLLALYGWSVALNIISSSTRGKPLVVFDSEPAVGESLAELAARENVELILLTTEKKMCSPPWRFLHPRASQRDIAKVIPINTGTFVQMRTDDELSTSILLAMPLNCKRLTYLDFLGDQIRRNDTSCRLSKITEHIDTSLFDCSVALIGLVSGMEAPEVGLNELASSKVLPANKQVIISWQKDLAIHVPIKPATERVQFLANKTYWLVGLTGGLGISLCRWMIARGARYIALTSRNPRIGPGLIRSMSYQRGVIEVFPGDVTSRESLFDVYRSISASMPSIKGVVQGAMVLHDAVFPQMNLERLEAVTRPKVQGSIYLDEIFRNNSLDFFIFLSSAAYAAGHAGQSAYAMANGFMAALAANRRHRGVAASVLNVGAIRGNGYVSREMSEDLQRALDKAGFSFLSEQMFHEVFAEGVLSSQPRSFGSYEITTGLSLEDSHSTVNSWRTNPVYSHLIAKAHSSISTTTQKSSAISITMQLSHAENDEQVMDIIADALLLKLRSILQLNDNQSLLGLSSDAIGVDSIIAVDMQSWFRQELKVEISILDIVNSRTINDLLRLVSNLFLADRSLQFAQIKPSNDSHGILMVSEIHDGIEGKISHHNEHIDYHNTEYELSAGTGSPTLSTLETVDSNKSTAETSEISETQKRKPESKRVVPLSFTQSRFWFLNSFEDSHTSFNVTTLITLKGHIDVHRLSSALNAVAHRHEALRTVFFFDEYKNGPVQCILPVSNLHLELETTIADEKIVEFAIRDIEKSSFNFSDGPLLRMKLLSQSEGTHYMVLGYHHIVMDGIGFEIFCSDLDSAYRGDLDTDNGKLLQYPDFTLRQLDSYKGGSWAKQLVYWTAQFADLPCPLPLLSLSHRSARPESLTFDSLKISFRLPKFLENSIMSCCQALGVNKFHFYLATFAILLFRLAGKGGTKDVCIGVADGNRKQSDTLKCLGLFLNLLPLRVRNTSDQSFADILKEVRLTSDNAFSNSEVPFDVILQELNVPRSSTTSPLFQAFINYRPNIRENRNFLGCAADGKSLSVGQNTYDISLDILESRDGENLVTIVGNKDLYSSDSLHILERSYTNLLQSFSQDPKVLPADAPLHKEEDVLNAIRIGQGQQILSKWPPTIIDRIETMTELYGDRPALRHGTASLTYQQMTFRVCHIANKIAELGIQAGSYVGILQAPGIDWVCSFLAIARTGATCVPMDLQVGMERLKLITQDCCPLLILCDSSTEEYSVDLLFEGFDTKVMNVTRFRTAPGALGFANRANPRSSMMITYTSGTTGVPKGIIIRHESVRNFVEFAPSGWGFKEAEETVLQQSSCTFDMALCQIMVCLGYAGTLVILDDTKRRDPDAICESIISQGVTFTLATPSEYLLWIQHGRNQLSQSDWKGAMSGGEPVTEALCREFKSLRKLELRLINCYGPAETTFGCAASNVFYMETVGAGDSLEPLPNYTIYILDDNEHPLPIGVPGRIAIGGAGVMIGYLNKDSLTATSLSRDLHSPVPLKSQGWSNFYLSEDYGRFNTAGRLIIEGRIQGSTQVKIGGIRIELEDIENSIVRYMSPYVRQAIVSHRKGKDGSNADFLVAFIVLSDTSPPSDPVSFITHLSRQLPLPQYMRPSLVLPIQSVPYTVSGKLDRKAIDSLPLTDTQTRDVSEKALHPGKSDTENILRHLWKDVLPNEVTDHLEINKHIDFFQVGGSSIALLNLQRRINEQFGTILSIQTLFQHTTLGQMALMLENRKERQNVLGLASTIDLYKETDIPPYITNLAVCKQGPVPRAQPQTIALTGATGFLGKEILRQLVNDAGIRRIHCIAIRRALDQLSNLFDNPKILIHSGNLAYPRLGLPHSVANEIFAEVDVFIHAAADVSFMKSYQSLKTTNLASTWEVVAMCLPRSIPLHFVSSAAISRLSGKDPAGPDSAEKYLPSDSNVDGYTATKWVAEVFLERVSRQAGLLVMIHRPSNITGDDAPALDLMGNLMKYARKTSTVPLLNGWSGYLDSISVETAAHDLIYHMKLGKDAWSVSSNCVRVHEVGEVETNIQNLQIVLEKIWGQRLEVRTVEEWVDGAVEAGMDDLLGTYLRETLSKPLILPRLLKTA